jgi:hypothetical protein
MCDGSAFATAPFFAVLLIFVFVFRASYLFAGYRHRIEPAASRTIGLLSRLCSFHGRQQKTVSFVVVSKSPAHHRLPRPASAQRICGRRRSGNFTSRGSNKRDSFAFGIRH